MRLAVGAGLALLLVLAFPAFEPPQKPLKVTCMVGTREHVFRHVLRSEMVMTGSYTQLRGNTFYGYPCLVEWDHVF